jgi:hypothetical protein
MIRHQLGDQERKLVSPHSSAPPQVAVMRIQYAPVAICRQDHAFLKYFNCVLISSQKGQEHVCIVIVRDGQSRAIGRNWRECEVLDAFSILHFQTSHPMDSALLFVRL